MTVLYTTFYLNFKECEQLYHRRIYILYDIEQNPFIKILDEVYFIFYIDYYMYRYVKTWLGVLK